MPTNKRIDYNILIIHWHLAHTCNKLDLKDASGRKVASIKPTCANFQAISGHLVFLLSGGTFLRTLNRRQFHLCLYQPSTASVKKRKCEYHGPIQR